jgi:hypothetical protein
LTTALSRAFTALVVMAEEIPAVVVETSHDKTGMTPQTKSRKEAGTIPHRSANAAYTTPSTANAAYTTPSTASTATTGA